MSLIDPAHQAQQNFPLAPPIPIPPQRGCLERTGQAFQRVFNCLQATDARIENMIANLYECEPCVGHIATFLYLPSFIRRVDRILNNHPPLRGAYCSMLPLVLFSAGALSYLVLRNTNPPSMSDPS